MKGFIAMAAAVAGGLLLSVAASAGPDQSSVSGLTSVSVLSMISSTGDDAFSTMSLSPVDPSGSPTQHFGPYASGSPDSGTCGNDWAQDTFDRDFTVRIANDGTTTIVEQFKNGSFTANAGPSPGACDLTDGTPAGMLNGGEAGSMHGYFVISNVTGQTSNSPYCNATLMTNANCTTATFVDTHFVPCYGLGICTVTTFFDHYAAGDEGLAEHEWKNASCDRGGNHGDIAALVFGPAPPPTACL